MELSWLRLIEWLTGVVLAMVLLAAPTGVEAKACAHSSATVFSFTLEDDTGESDKDTTEPDEDTTEPDEDATKPDEETAVSKEDTTQLQDECKESSSPETGDDSQLLIWSAVFIASGIFAVVKIKKSV